MRNTRFRGAAIAGVASMSLAAAGLALAAAPAQASGGHRQVSGMATGRTAHVAGSPGPSRRPGSP